MKEKVDILLTNFDYDKALDDYYKEKYDLE